MMRRFNSFLDPMPRVIAHRGDSKNYPENTLDAFLSAARMGIDVIETDVHLSKDGVLVIWHDPSLDRNTDGSGSIESHTYQELLRYDAGYTFTKDGGKTFPFRGKGVKLCTVSEALKACPDERFNVDLKSKNTAIVDEFIRVVRENKAEDRVVCASFHYKNLKLMRKKAPDIMTSITTLEVIPLVLRQKLHILPKSFKRKIICIPDKAESFFPCRIFNSVDPYIDNHGITSAHLTIKSSNLAGSNYYDISISRIFFDIRCLRVTYSHSCIETFPH